MSLHSHTSHLPSYSFLLPPRTQKFLDHLLTRAQKSVYTQEVNTRSYNTLSRPCTVPPRTERRDVPCLTSDVGCLHKGHHVRWNSSRHRISGDLNSWGSVKARPRVHNEGLDSDHPKTDDTWKSSNFGQNSEPLKRTGFIRITPKQSSPELRHPELQKPDNNTTFRRPNISLDSRSPDLRHHLSDPSLNNIWNQFNFHSGTMLEDEDAEVEQSFDSQDDNPSTDAQSLSKRRPNDRRLHRMKFQQSNVGAPPEDIFALLFDRQQASNENSALQTPINSVTDQTFWSRTNQTKGPKVPFWTYRDPTLPPPDNTYHAWQDRPVKPYTPRIPSDASLQEKEAIYLDFIEHFLPPHLTSRRVERQKRTASTIVPLNSPISTLDAPTPAVFGKDGQSINFLHDLQTGDDESGNLEVWEQPPQQRYALRLLRILEEARVHKIDILSILINKHRENAVFWIVQILLGPAEEFVHQEVNPWAGNFAIKVYRNKNRLFNLGPQSEIRFTIDQEVEKSRRKHGLGLILGSLSHTLMIGWRKQLVEASENEESRTIDVLDLFGRKTQIDLYNPENDFPDRLDPLFINKKKISAMKQVTSEEIFNNAVYIIAYLYSLDQIPKKTFSPKNTLLSTYQSSFLEEMGGVALNAFNQQGDFTLPKQARENPIEWGLWLYLVTVIASEHGLGVGACEVLSVIENHAIFQNDDAINQKLLRHLEDKLNSERPSIDTMLPSSTLLPQLLTGQKSNDSSKLLLPESMLSEMVDSLLCYNSFDSCKSDNMHETLVLLERISKTHDGLQYSTIRDRILTHPDIDLRKPYGEIILKIKFLRDGWPVEVWYEVLFGMIDRADNAGVVRVWSGIERVFGGDSMNGQFLDSLSVSSGDAAVLAKNPVIIHPTHVLSGLLKHLKDHEIERRFLLEHIIRTSITKETALDPSILDHLISFAARSQDLSIVESFLPPVSSSLDQSTLLAILNLRLRLNQVDEASNAVKHLEKKNNSIAELKLGILIRNAYQKSFEKGNELLDQALSAIPSRSSKQTDEVDSTIDENTYQFSEDVALSINPTHPPKLRDVDGKWIALLNAAVSAGNRERASQALKGLNIDLKDVSAVAKMGTHLFNIMLKGVVSRQGSELGMVMFKAYCIDLSKPNDTGGLSGAAKSNGRVAPNSVTLKTIIHQALRERLKWQIKKRELTHAGEPQAMGDIKDTDFERVIQWARYTWDALGLGEQGWRELMNKNLSVYNPIDRAKIEWAKEKEGVKEDWNTKEYRNIKGSVLRQKMSESPAQEEGEINTEQAEPAQSEQDLKDVR